MKTLIVVLCLLTALRGWGQKAASEIMRGNEYYRTGQYDLAEKHYRAALAAEPNNNIAAYNLANALYRQKRYRESVGILQKIRVDQNNPAMQAAVYYNTGVNHTKEKDLEASIEAYKAALRITPDDKEARENLQKALLELKKEQQQKQQRQQRSSMSQSEADRRLQQLQQKEKQIQERLQRNSQQKGNIMEKDW